MSCCELLVTHEFRLTISQCLLEFWNEIDPLAASVRKELLITLNEIEVGGDVLGFQLFACFTDQVALRTVVEGADVGYWLVVLRTQNFTCHYCLIYIQYFEHRHKLADHVHMNWVRVEQ